MDTNFRIMKWILTFLSPLLLLAACGNGSLLEGKYPSGNKTDVDEGKDTPAPDDSKTYKILFMGNSLTLDATTLLPSLLNGAGIKNIELYRTFHGAYTLPLYNSNFSNPGICSFCTWKPGQDRWRGTETYDYSPEYAVTNQEYDIICLQEYSGQKYAWSWSDESKNAYIELIDKINAAHSGHKPEIIALFSHTFGKGMERLIENFDNDNVRQFEACAATLRKVLEETQIEKVISPAAAVQNLRTTGLNKDSVNDMTRGDQTHSDYGITRFAEAAVIFKEIITPLTGKRIEDTPFRLREYYPHPTLHTTPITDENFPIVMKAVENACAKPLEITDMSEYTQTFTYQLAPGSFSFSDYCDTQEPCSFPVEFILGNGAVDSYKQPYWSGYGIWASTQQQAYGKWVIASNAIDGMFPTRNFASNGAISSPGIRGLWTGDYMEFVIPVEGIKAGTQVEFSAPFYTRQGPVFWTFEWLDGDEWKSNDTKISSPDNSFTCQASFALKAGTTYITQIATFAEAISTGNMKIRIKVADGSIQADSATTTSVKRDLPNHTDNDYSSVFYFYGSGVEGSALRFRIIQ